jgi:HrpA-like RNA helicase
VDGMTQDPARGVSHTAMRGARCKDCVREERRGLSSDAAQFEYNEAWAQRVVDLGGTRTDRCPRHRGLHRQAIQGMAVAYVDLQTIGEVRNRANPTGPLGGLGELPERHLARQTSVELAAYQFGMTDNDIVDVLAALQEKQVLILRAGTGTGKSTFVPFRLMNPPGGAPFRPTDNGPIVVTEPRVQATTGVARFVGEKLVMGCAWQQCSIHGWFDGAHPGELSFRCQITDCARHIGPGYPVGYQVKGDKNHDDSCQLVYVTDGTMINWLKEGRLGHIGTVIVDEAHERSTNIDFILGFLNRELSRHPHLRVIVTSATFDVNFYVQFFGGEERVAWRDVPPAKAFGYGDPLFPGEDVPDVDAWIVRHWPARYGPHDEDGHQEDVWATTRMLHELRSAKVIDPDRWRTEMPALMANFLVGLVRKLDEAEVYGDVLAFLPTEKTITPVVEAVRNALSAETVDVYALLSSIDTRQKEAALAARPRGAKRKIVVSTNLAETSLTVSGVRFVVDSGLICQEEWNPSTVSGSLPTKPHSQAGVRQRWGRVGRDRPGWVFPLYSRAQFVNLPLETPPGSSRSNLEQLYTKAKAGGIDDPVDFPWPAGFIATGVEVDETARQAVTNFGAELARSASAARANGIIDVDGHLTSYGRELDRFAGVTSAAAALATMYADQLACVPEVVMALTLLEGRQLRGVPKPGRHFLLPMGLRWPAEWKVQAATRHRALTVGCRDDLDVALRIVAAWEAVDSSPPWTDSPTRREWAAKWWIDHEVLVGAASHRRDVLSLLSPAMKEEANRPIDSRLVPRARAVLCRAMRSLEYIRRGDEYQLVADPKVPPAVVDRASLLEYRSEKVIALQRRSSLEGDKVYIQNLIEVYPWATAGDPDAFELIQLCAENCSPHSLVENSDTTRLIMDLWPIGARFLATVSMSSDGIAEVDSVEATRRPFAYTVELEARAAAEDAESSGDEAILIEGNEDLVETGWPTGNPDPHEDDEILDRITVLDPADPLNGLEANDDDATLDLSVTNPVIDVMGNREFRSVLDSKLSRYVIAEAAIATGEPTWVSCNGYEVSAESAVRPILVPDWLSPDVDGDPSLHTDLGVGAEVEVRVGRLVSDGLQRYRAFNRVDGRGRFLLPIAARRALNEAPSAFDPHDRELLVELEEGAELCCVVVPAQSGTKSISLLPMLARHLDRGQRQQLFSPGATSGRRLPFWPAIVIAVPVEGQWGIVELAHGDETLGIRHRFGLHWAASGIDNVELEPGARVLVQLRTDSSAKLLASADLAAAIEEQFPRYVQVRSSGNKSALHARRQLPSSVRDALLNVGSTEPWIRRVWTFYLQSHARRIGAILPSQGPTSTRSPVVSTEAYRPFRSGLIVLGTVLEVEPAGVAVAFQHGAKGFATSANIPEGVEFITGLDVVARVHAVDSDKRRLILNLKEPYVFSGDIPSHWCDTLTCHRDHFEREIHGRYELRGTLLTVVFSDANSAEHGLSVLRFLSSLPAAEVEVPARRKGRVIGSSGSTLARLQGTPGVWTCQFVQNADLLRIVCDSVESMLSVLDEVAALAGGVATGTMTVPGPAANGALIGKGGETVNRLKRESGCFQARSARGSATWTLKANSAEAISLFIDLASAVVPGCTGQIDSVDEPPVTDLSDRLIVADWRSHRFGDVQTPPWLHVSPVTPVDLRPSVAEG